jgi:hypothetical protein
MTKKLFNILKVGSLYKSSKWESCIDSAINGEGDPLGVEPEMPFLVVADCKLIFSKEYHTYQILYKDIVGYIFLNRRCNYSYEEL